MYKLDPDPSLQVIETAYCDRVDRLLQLAQDYYANWDQPQGRRLATYITLDAVSSWELFARAFFLSWVLGSVSTTGAIIQCRITGHQYSHALAMANQALSPNLRGMSGGPNWKGLDSLEMLSSRFNFSNPSPLIVATAYQSDALRHMVRVRNYFAHKSEDTLRKARRLANEYSLVNASQLGIYEMLSASVPATGRPLLGEWLADHRAYAQILCR